MQGSPDAKKPCKGILKTSSSFDRHSGSGASYRKSAKFDELNVMQTYHPQDKDYGHMKIEEPKTPYNYADTDESIDALDADLLAEKLRVAARTSSFDVEDEYSSDDNVEETSEEKAKRLDFEKRRKFHYNEYEAVRLARRLIEEEADDDDEENEAKGQGDSTRQPTTTTDNTNSSDKEMDIDVPSPFSTH